MNEALEVEAEELAGVLMIAHDGDALEARNDARAVAALATQRLDEPTARLHTLAADFLESKHPQHFCV